MGEGHEHDDLIEREDAVNRILDLREGFLGQRETRDIPLAEIPGSILSRDITAESASPPISRATMDGFAVDANEEFPLEVQPGEVFPEDEPGHLNSGESVRVATGAPIPEGANAVLKREEATVEGGSLSGTDLSAGTYVYERGTNYSKGETLFHEGERLGARDAILLGDLGMETVPIRELYSAGIVATGTEIHENPDRDLDSDMLAGLVRSWGHRPFIGGTAPDEYGLVRDLIEKTAR
ncbi:MAG: molybdopterin molybdenumtransferase MoeA, partial [Halobacteriaceae archaeon]